MQRLPGVDTNSIGMLCTAHCCAVLRVQRPRPDVTGEAIEFRVGLCCDCITPESTYELLPAQLSQGSSSPFHPPFTLRKTPIELLL
jgi:hypothetical protein